MTNPIINPAIGFEPTAASKQAVGQGSRNESDSNDVRFNVLLLRQKRKAAMSASTSQTIEEISYKNPDRWTWDSVNENIEHLAPSISSHLAAAVEPRNSDEEDDADSTVLGHLVQALPIPPQKPPADRQKQLPRPPSFASEETGSSSQDSSSHRSCSIQDDLDVPGLHTTKATNGSSRRVLSRRTSIASRRRSKQLPSKDLITSASPGQSSFRSIGPPPNLPLPPKPISSPHNRSPSSRSGESWPSGRSRRTSALTTASSRSSTSEASGWRSSDPSRASFGLMPTPTERSDTSEVSDEEIVGIRNISKHFPSPTSSVELHPSTISRMLDQTSPRATPRPVPAPEYSQTASRLRRSATRSQKGSNRNSKEAASPVLYSTHDGEDQISLAEGQTTSDSALSDVLNLTDSKGILSVSKLRKQASLNANVCVAQVGLRPAFKGPSNSSKPEGQQAPGDGQNNRRQTSTTKPRKSEMHHRRDSTMSESMSQLVVALDLESDEWQQRLGKSEPVHLQDAQVVTLPAQGAAGIGIEHPDARLSRHTSKDTAQPNLPNSDLLPSLSSSGSHEHSLDDSRGPATAESSLIRSNSAKSLASAGGSVATVSEDGASIDLRSIYEAYRLSSSTAASRFTAPTVRIEDPHGDEVSDSELEGGVASVDHLPRKRNKLSRNNSLGFDDQRAALRSRPSFLHRSVSLSTKPSQTFHLTLLPTEEENGSASDHVSATTESEGTDPYAFYEFSPSLPPFMPSGVSPRDLTGRGTWSSIVARASESIRSRHPSVASLDSFSTAASGPVSMREIRATAQARQREADAAHRAREQMSEQFATVSYRPFAIHDHAASFAIRAEKRTSQRFSVASMPGEGSPSQDLSGRSTSMSSSGYVESVASSTGDYGTRWPVAIGADQEVGPDDASSMFVLNPFSLSRRPSASQPPAKVYVEFSMQTSPQPSPSQQDFPPLDSLTIDDHVDRADAQVGSDVREAKPVGPLASLDYLGIDAPLRRRKSTASLLSICHLDVELDQPGVWPSQIRAPRLSSFTRRRSEEHRPAAAAQCQESDSDVESDLDVHANLEDLAERSGVLDESRGSKRKLYTSTAVMAESASGNDSLDRPIASIPARSRRISAALDRIRAQRFSRSAGWNSSDDEDDAESAAKLNTPRRTAASGRPSLPTSIAADENRSADQLRRSKSMASIGASKRNKASRTMLRVRSPSPDLSIMTAASDDEEVLLTADLELDSVELSRDSVLDKEFDMMIGQTISPRFSSSTKGSSHRKRGDFGNAAIYKHENAVSKSSETAVDDDGSPCGTEDSKDSQQTVQDRSRSRTSSMSSVFEMIQEADELLSSTGHSIGHDTIISDSGGTSGHDPQRPNQMVAEMIRRRVSMRSRGVPIPDTLAVPQLVRVAGLVADKDGRAVEDAKVDAGLDDDVSSLSLQDTPDTMGGSEIWSSFHADRSSTISTATTRSCESTEDARTASRTALTSFERPKDQQHGSSGACAPATASAVEKQGDIDATASRVIPILRRKSSALPVGRPALQKQSRPSLPLPSKASIGTCAHDNMDGSSSALASPSVAVRRYQSVAGLRSRIASIDRSASDRKDTSKVQGPARHSDGHSPTPSSATRSSGVGGLTPSKLPSLRPTASTTSLRSCAASANTTTASARPSIPKAAVRSRLPSPGGVRASGLPRPAPT